MALPDQVIYSTQDVGNMRHCNGNPNTVGVYGQLGWTCQDWASGLLYVYTETAGANAWTQVTTDGGISTGGDGTVFVTDGGYAQWSSVISDSFLNAVLSWGYDYRYLSDTNSIASIDVGNRMLFTNNEQPVIQWYDGLRAFDYAGAQSIEATEGNRYLADYTGAPSVDFGNRFLQNGIGDNVFEWLNNFATRINLYATNAESPVASTGTQSFTPTSGALVTPDADSATLLVVYLGHTATIAALTVALQTCLDVLPDGGRVTIFARSTVTALTITALNYTVIGTAVTTLAAGASIEYVKVTASRSSTASGGTLLRIR